MYWDYWIYWLLSIIWVLIVAESAVKYAKTKQKWCIAKVLFSVVGAVCFVWIGEYNRGWHIRDAEHELRDRASEAKSKMSGWSSNRILPRKPHPRS